MVTRNGHFWVFRTSFSGARSVNVVGDFNGWDSQAAPMQRIGLDGWMALLVLDPGDYRFRYLVDGHHWLTDYAAFGVIRNELGGWDSVLHVPCTAECSPKKQIEPHRGESLITTGPISGRSSIQSLAPDDGEHRIMLL